MSVTKILLDDFSSELISVGLVRLAKSLENYEFFYHLNKANHFNFERADDLVLQKKYFRYQHSVFQGYHNSTKSCFRFLKNKSIASEQISEMSELFSDETEHNYLLQNFVDTDYILTVTDPSPDFSLILLPENLTFQLQEIELDPEAELYQIIQYYE